MLHDTRYDLNQDSQDLLNAADYIDKNGWCQGMTSSGKSVCLWGSLLAVTDGLDKYYTNAPRALMHLGPERSTLKLTITWETMQPLGTI